MEGTNSVLVGIREYKCGCARDQPNNGGDSTTDTILSNIIRCKNGECKEPGGDQRDKEGKLLFASQDGERVKLTSKNLLISYLKHPLMTLKIISAIHYEALKLWIKGIKLVKKNLKIKNNTSYEN